MKRFLPALFALMLVVLSNNCRKKDCPAPELDKTDELSNTTWLGAYGRQYPDYRQLDTVIILAMKPNGFINVYTERDTTASGVKGKGFYSFDGKNFKATISLFKVGFPYQFEGAVTSEKIVISGSIIYNANNRDGVFEIVQVTSL